MMASSNPFLKALNNYEAMKSCIQALMNPQNYSRAHTTNKSSSYKNNNKIHSRMVHSRFLSQRRLRQKKERESANHVCCDIKKKESSGNKNKYIIFSPHTLDSIEMFDCE